MNRYVGRYLLGVCPKVGCRYMASQIRGAVAKLWAVWEYKSFQSHFYGPEQLFGYVLSEFEMCWYYLPPCCVGVKFTRPFTCSRANFDLEDDPRLSMGSGKQQYESKNEEYQMYLPIINFGTWRCVYLGIT